VRVLRKILIFVLTFQFLLGFGAAFSQTPFQSETSQLTPSEQLAFDIFETGKAAHDGKGVPQDFVRARMLYLEAADFGSTEALINLGYLYFTGQGVEPDLVKAREFYQMAAKRGSVDAIENLKMMDAQGLGISPVAKPIAPVKIREPELPQKVETFVDKSEKIVLEAKKADAVETHLAEATPKASVPSEPSDVSPALRPAQTFELPQASIPLPLAIDPKPMGQKQASIFSRSNSFAAFLTGLAALVLAIHVVTVRKQNRAREIRRQFVQSFYDAKRNDLRLTYLRRRDGGVAPAIFYREWQATLTALMARFALNFDEPNETLQAFCQTLNHGLSQNLRPTKYLASEFSDEMMLAAVTEIKAVDAFQMANISEGAETLVSGPPRSDAKSSLQSNVVKLFQRKSRQAT
jgi:hypothetical protein